MFSFAPSGFTMRMPKGRKAPRRAKPFVPGPKLVEQLVTWATDRSWVELQMSMKIDSPQANGHQHTNANDAHIQVEDVLRALRAYLRGLDRSLISGITFTRLHTEKSKKGLAKHDNLRGAFKHICDATCAWIVEGPNEFNRRTIGKYDDLLEAQWTEGTGRTWPPNYTQQMHETDTRLWGIRIRLHLGSS